MSSRPTGATATRPTSTTVTHPTGVTAIRPASAVVTRPAAVPAWPLQSFLRLVPAPASVPTARRHMRQALTTWDLDPLVDPAELVVSELVTNAVRAALALAEPQPVQLWLAADRVQVAIGIWDGNPDPPLLAPAADTDERGRGLWLVEALSAAWDWFSQDGGRTVHALLEPDPRA
jgi:anti-sigma regulatory factor (Ser/Thr protein kinase)